MTTTSPYSGHDPRASAAASSTSCAILQFHEEAYQYRGRWPRCSSRTAASPPWGWYEDLARDIPAGAEVVDHRGKLLVPGFIDTHVHYPQTDIIASPSPGLLPTGSTPTPFPRNAASASRPTRVP